MNQIEKKYKKAYDLINMKSRLNNLEWQIKRVNQK